MTDEIIVKFDQESNIYTLELSQEKFKALREALHSADVIHEELKKIRDDKKRLFEIGAFLQEGKKAKVQERVEGLTKILDLYFNSAKEIAAIILYKKQ